MTRPTHSTHYLGDLVFSANRHHREVDMASPANGYAAELGLEIFIAGLPIGSIVGLFAVLLVLGW